MVDAFITATPGSGTNVETSQLTRSDGTVVQRERVNIGDSKFVGNLGAMTSEGAQFVRVEQMDELVRVMKQIKWLLQIGFEVDAPEDVYIGDD